MHDLMKAVYDRWVAAGLDDSICELYPAGESRIGGRNSTGSPTDATLPRAEYEVSTPAPSIKTRNSRTAQALATIRIWDTKTSLADASERVATHVKNVRAKYVNADELGMDMDNGDILEVDDAGSGCVKVDDDVWMGVQTLAIRHRINNVATA